MFLGIDHGRHTRFGGWAQPTGAGRRERVMISRIEAFEAFRADGVALGLHLRVAISATDLRDERYLGGGAHGGYDTLTTDIRWTNGPDE